MQLGGFRDSYEIPIGQLVQVDDAAASAVADAKVELSYTLACAAVKADANTTATQLGAQLGAHWLLNSALTGCAPRALAVLPVLEAEGVLQSVRQAPRRRARAPTDAVAVQASQQQPEGLQRRSRR